MAIKHLALPVKLVFKNKEQLAPGVYRFNFAPTKALHWKAGQHGLLEIRLASGKTGRKLFSISSAPADGVISITTKANPLESGAFKRRLLQLKKGSTAQLRGPVGNLYIKNHNQHYVFMATGIGITPFYAILAQLAAEKSKTHVTLFYSNNSGDHYYRDQLSEFNKHVTNLSIKYINKPERITGHIIEDTLGTSLYDCVFLLAGSPKNITSYRRTLQGLGIHRKQIISDPFYTIRPVKIVIPAKMLQRPKPPKLGFFGNK